MIFWVVFFKEYHKKFKDNRKEFCDIFPKSTLIYVSGKISQKYVIMLEFELNRPYKSQEVAEILNVTYDSFRHSRKRYEEKLSNGYE